MGKERLKWLRYQQKRVGDYFCDIELYKHKCPLCGDQLFSAYLKVIQVMDGNNVIHCEANEHTFYESSWDIEPILYYNDDASETSFDYKTRYKMIDNNWVEMGG